MIVGPYTVSRLEAGDFRLDGGAMFGVVPKPLWERTHPADELNRISMVCRCLLIEGNGRKILVDTGIGDKDSNKFRELYGVDNNSHTLLRSLAARAITPAEITDVILTHLHFDHAGGATHKAGGQTVPVFSNARHYVQKRQFEHAQTGSERDRASYLPPNYMPLVEAGLLDLPDGNTELLPGIELLTVDGHTPAMQTVKISGGDSVVWYPADLLPTAAHIPLPYIMGYDLYPMTTLAEKKTLLPRAAAEDWTLVFEHDAAHPARRVTVTERGDFSAGETVALD